ncbi:IS3 family transposase [Corynebacterium pseudogenitalium]|uniref:IS3 family transposase n=1 Tax=Corynebacterium pseudogenitalium TaxID=38303 RepID=UPI0034E1D751
MIRFIDEYRNRICVEFICQTLSNHREGGFITSRGYRQSKARGVSARAFRDAALIEYISEIHAENYGVYGVRKMWRVLRRQGIDIGRVLRRQGIDIGREQNSPADAHCRSVWQGQR